MESRLRRDRLGLQVEPFQLQVPTVTQPFGRSHLKYSLTELKTLSLHICTPPPPPDVHFKISTRFCVLAAHCGAAIELPFHSNYNLFAAGRRPIAPALIDVASV